MQHIDKDELVEEFRTIMKVYCRSQDSVERTSIRYLTGLWLERTRDHPDGDWIRSQYHAIVEEQLFKKKSK